MYFIYKDLKGTYLKFVFSYFSIYIYHGFLYGLGTQIINIKDFPRLVNMNVFLFILI